MWALVMFIIRLLPPIRNAPLGLLIPATCSYPLTPWIALGVITCRAKTRCSSNPLDGAEKCGSGR